LDAGAAQFGFTPGDVVVVTGAGSGIGRAVAVHAAGMGLAVAAWDRDEATVADTVTEIETAGGRAVAVTADVTAPEQVDAGFARSRELGVVRHLVNNAGPSSAVAMDFDEAIVVSVGSMRRMVDTWLASGAPDGASLVNIASVAGKRDRHRLRLVQRVQVGRRGLDAPSRRVPQRRGAQQCRRSGDDRHPTARRLRRE